MKESVEWKDVEDFIKWYLADDHHFDVLYNGDNEPDAFINTNSGKSYTHRELFDYYIKYVKK